MYKLSSGSISLVVLDSFYKLNCFFVNIFSPYCFHYVVVLLLSVAFRGGGAMGAPALGIQGRGASKESGYKSLNAVAR